MRAKGWYLFAFSWTCIGVCASTPALAQSDVPKEVLRGPDVKDRQAPGVSGRFSEGESRRFKDEQIPARAYRAAFEKLASPDAAPEIRATPEQIERAKAIWAEHENAVKAYMDEHKGKVADARRANAAGEQQKGDSSKDTDEMMAPQARMDEARRAELRKIMANAPKPEAAIRRVWSELTEAQQHFVQSEIDKIRNQMSQDRQEKYVRERATKAGVKTDVKPDTRGQGDRVDAPPPGGDDDRITPERRQRLLRLFASMSPSDQDLVLQRLEQRLKEQRAGGQGEGASKDDRKPAKKQPPKVDTVKVPNPD